ncbi:hypothetical protein HK096_006591 [Nowakowskiella sp. JEL0078]|nr:hypothetical protein HK096_006591 [Nowakowskiella sp. JEL0078]
MRNYQLFSQIRKHGTTSFPNFPWPQARNSLESERITQFLWPVRSPPFCNYPKPVLLSKPNTWSFVFMDKITSSLASTVVKSAYGVSYFESDIRSGATHAFTAFIPILNAWLNSQTDDTTHDLQRLTTRTFFSHLQQSLYNFKPDVRINLSLRRVDTSASPVDHAAVIFGPSISAIPTLLRDRYAVRTYALGKEYIQFRWFANSFVIARDLVMDRNNKMWNLCADAMEEGVIMRVVLDISAKITVSEGYMVWDESAGKKVFVLSREEDVERTFSVTLESPHMNFELVNRGAALEAGVWKIADIDDVVEAQTFENMMMKSMKQG